MDIHQLKQRIDASGKKLVTLGNEYIKSKDGVSKTLLTWIFVQKKMKKSRKNITFFQSDPSSSYK